jgi:hypothetical protein
MLFWGATPKPARKAAPAMSDAALEQAIRARFAKSKIAQNQFSVKVNNGVATITGNTEIVQHKGTATRLAKSAGATAVVNNVAISKAAREKAASALKRPAEAPKAIPSVSPAKPEAGPAATPSEPLPPPTPKRAAVKH